MFFHPLHSPSCPACFQAYTIKSLALLWHQVCLCDIEGSKWGDITGEKPTGKLYRRVTEGSDRVKKLTCWFKYSLPLLCDTVSGCIISTIFTLCFNDHKNGRLYRDTHLTCLFTKALYSIMYLSCYRWWVKLVNRKCIMHIFKSL